MQSHIDAQSSKSLKDWGIPQKFSFTDHMEDGKEDKIGMSVAGLDATAAAYVASGEVSARLGSEDFNVHSGAKGKLLGAEAKAKAGFVAGKDGVGVAASASAEAYLAKGEVSAGFTFLGIDVKASVGGKAGAVGAHAGGQVTTGGVKADVGASALLGVDLGIEIDWSGFEMPDFEWSDLDVFGWFD